MPDIVVLLGGQFFIIMLCIILWLMFLTPRGDDIDDLFK